MKDHSWKNIFEAIPLPCLVLKPTAHEEFVILDANCAYLGLVGLHREDLLNKETGEAFPPNPKSLEYGHNEISNSFVEVVKTGQSHCVESLRYDVENRSSGKFEERYFTSENIPLKNSDGEVEYILHTTRDVTSEAISKQKEKAFKEELALKRQQYKNFISGNPDGLYSLDLDGNFIHANEGLSRITEIPVKQILGRNFIETSLPCNKNLVRECFEKALQGEVSSFEADFISGKGEKLILKVLLMPMMVEGKVTQVHGIAKDVTEIRLTEKVMVEKSRFLEVNAAFISSLLENEINDDALHETFEIIGKTVEADRMYYFGADEDPETGEVLISQKAEWCSENALPQINNPEMQNMPLNRVEEISSLLIKNLPFTATYSTLSPGGLKEIFKEQDIKSMLLLPIFLDDRLFGFVGFDDCISERIWKDEEITFLRSLTQNLTNAFDKRAALDKIKKREDQLEKSEKLFRALVQEGSDLMAILNTRGIYSFVSENYKRILGFETGDLVGTNVEHLIHPEDLERVQEQFDQLRRKKQVLIPAFRFLDKNGNYRWVETIATNLLKDPAVNGIVVNSRDVTRVIEQAQKIEEINERYQLAATATQDLIYDLDLRNNTVNRFHRGQEEVFGYPPEEMNRQDFWDEKIHPDDLQKEQKKLNAALANPSQNFIKTEYRFKQLDGTYAQVVDKGYIIRDSSGKAIRLVGATSDISEITAQKEALKIANERFKMAMIATNEMIWDWDIATDSVTRSKGYKSIFGYDTNEATSVHSFWLNKVAENDRLKLKTSLELAIKDPTNQKWSLEYRLNRSDGTIAYVNDRGYIIRDENGKATRMVGAVLDVTNSRKLLRRIQRQNKVLKEIAWEQSHIVRAPVARIKGLLDLLEQDDCKEMEPEEILFHIKNSANELDGIIRNIVGKTEEIDVEIQ